METNHLDEATSDAKDTSYVHHSSFPQPETDFVSHPSQTVNGIAGSQVNGIEKEAGLSSSTPRPTLPNINSGGRESFGSGLQRLLWPFKPDLDWNTCCVTWATRKKAKIGQAICRQDIRRSRRRTRQDTKYKPVLEKYLQSSSRSPREILTSIGHGLDDAERERWMNHIARHKNKRAKRNPNKSKSVINSVKEANESLKVGANGKSSYLDVAACLGHSGQLKKLIEAGDVKAGDNAVSLDHDGFRYFADLSPDGKICFRGALFSSLREFTLHVTRTSSDNAKGGAFDGICVDILNDRHTWKDFEGYYCNRRRGTS